MRKKRVLRILYLWVWRTSCHCLLFCLVSNGIILLNNPSSSTYPIRVVDVSSYQGVSFAFIKATEGSGFVDEHFAYNYSRAQKAGLRAGAYHFFVMTAPAKRRPKTLSKPFPLRKTCFLRLSTSCFKETKNKTLPERKKPGNSLLFRSTGWKPTMERNPSSMQRKNSTSSISRMDTRIEISGYATLLPPRAYPTRGHGPFGNIPTGRY